MSTILYIIVFILCLSMVVCIHELGHLLVAKMCNVYCFEYSIGFGPAIFKKKFKHKKKVMQNGKPVFEARTDGKKVPMTEKVEGETAFALRALPLGGYVAMAGEDGNVTEDGRAIEKARCLNGVNHFKQICIMLAGIAMNFILAWVLFFGSALLPSTRSIPDQNAITVVADTEASKAGLQTGDKILYLYQEYRGLADENGKEITESVYFPKTKENTAINYYQTKNNGQAVAGNDTYNDLDHDCISYALQDIFKNSLHKIFTINSDNTLAPDGVNIEKSGVTPSSTRVIHLKTDKSDDWMEITLSTKETKENDLSYYFFDALGISAMTEPVNRNFVQSVTYASKSFGTYFVGIYTSLGSLFTPSGWQNVGGIISVYKMSTSGLQSGSFSYFLLLWGYISLNLGCFNLLPFPGLDGWQTLIALIETISRKKLPTKAKGIANTIGLIIMLILAGLLIVKDLIV